MNHVPKMKITEFVDLKFFYNFYSLRFSVGRVSLIASRSEKEVQSFHEVQSYRLWRYIDQFRSIKIDLIDSITIKSSVHLGTATKLPRLDYQFRTSTFPKGKKKRLFGGNGRAELRNWFQNSHKIGGQMELYYLHILSQCDLSLLPWSVLPRATVRIWDRWWRSSTRPGASSRPPSAPGGWSCAPAGEISCTRRTGRSGPSAADCTRKKIRKIIQRVLNAEHLTTDTKVVDFPHPSTSNKRFQFFI